MATSTQSTGVEGGPTHINPQSRSQPHSSIPVEMSDLEASTRTGAGSQGLLDDVSIPQTSPLTSTFPATTSTSDMGGENTKSAESAGLAISTSAVSKDPLSSSRNEHATVEAPAGPSSAGPSSAHPLITRLDSIAIGPSTDTMPTPVVAQEAGPVLVITLLLTSGARHPYKIDERYLTKRNVNVPGMTVNGRKDPFSISVYTLKELILREWREEWEAQPSSPSSIRLIYFGRLLDDKTPLKGSAPLSLLSNFFF